MQKGIALPTILIFGVISMVFIATIYYFLGREIRITGSTPVFMSIRDATYSAVDLAKKLANVQRPCSGTKNKLYTQDRIKFSLRGRQDVFTSDIKIYCLIPSTILSATKYQVYLISVETCKWNSITNNCADNSEYYKVEVLYPIETTNQS